MGNFWGNVQYHTWSTEYQTIKVCTRNLRLVRTRSKSIQHNKTLPIPSQRRKWIYNWPGLKRYTRGHLCSHFIQVAYLIKRRDTGVCLFLMQMASEDIPPDGRWLSFCSIARNQTMERYGMHQTLLYIPLSKLQHKWLLIHLSRHCTGSDS